MGNLNKIMWGFLLVIIGIILGLNVLEITNINLFFDGWWTLFIILPSFINLFDRSKNKVGNIIGLCIGGALLLSSQGFIQFKIVFKLIVPFILIVVGISFILDDKLKTRINDKFNSINKDDLENIVAVFGKQNIDKTSIKFKGANIDVVFGEVVLDLRNAILKDEIFIKASSIFGGINIKVPDDVNVQLKIIPIFGGISNKVKNNKINNKTIYIDAFCLFGGIDIK